MLKPLLTEKSYNQAEENSLFAFITSVKTKKQDVKDYFKNVFNLVPQDIRVVNYGEKKKRNMMNNTFYYKKAYKKVYVIVKEASDELKKLFNLIKKEDKKETDKSTIK